MRFACFASVLQAASSAFAPSFFCQSAQRTAVPAQLFPVTCYSSAAQRLTKSRNARARQRKHSLQPYLGSLAVCSMHRFLLAAVAAAATQPQRQRHEIGKLPALGYNTWNDVRCDGVAAASVAIRNLCMLHSAKLGLQ